MVLHFSARPYRALKISFFAEVALPSDELTVRPSIEEKSWISYQGYTSIKVLTTEIDICYVRIVKYEVASS